ncbi:hypothetical protein [Streptomyces sp. NPDC093970]|uniref:hypothetical protein n=1 Tax=Streptomyces sp. NPDC093970 TaxID=3155076 RepID=UPI00344853E3
MPAGHDGREGESEGVDALYAVLTGERLTDAQRTDPGFMAEHRAAADDVALLRAQLATIGDALAEPRPVPRPEPRPGRWRRPGVRSLGLACALAAAFASAVIGLGWLTANGVDDKGAGGSADSAAASVSGGKADAGPGRPACARLVVEGTVTGVRRLPDAGLERVTLRVTRAYEPAGTTGEVDLVLALDARIRTGARLLVGVARGASVADLYAVGETGIARERAGIVRDLSGPGPTTCPGT